VKVQIENNFYLESDSMQFIIKEYVGRTDKEGRDVTNTLGYFGTVQGALDYFYLKRKVKESTATNLVELLADIKALKELLNQTLGGV
jgi:hypothetical protein